MQTHSEDPSTVQRRRRHRILTWCGGVLAWLVIGSCVSRGEPDPSVHRWWSGLGPVLSHDGFPGDCRLCHAGSDWNTLVADFQFDHAKETGVPLNGAHSAARCLLCHNDRGPVANFASQGCAGCHEDVHQGTLGRACDECHGESTWQPKSLVAQHVHSRLPLTGAHANVSCQRCHPGAFAAKFVPTDTECVTCHADDLAQANNPPHLGLGWVDRCNRCHIPTHWRQAQVR